MVQKDTTSQNLIVGFIVIMEFRYINFYQMKSVTLLDDLFHLLTYNTEVEQAPS